MQNIKGYGLKNSQVLIKIAYWFLKINQKCHYTNPYNDPILKKKKTYY